MGFHLQQLYGEKRRLMARWRREAREGRLESVVLPLIPRNPGEISEAEESAGDIDQPTGLWCTTISNPNEGVKGGSVSMATISTAAERHIFNQHSIRLSTAAEIEAELSRQNSLLESRRAAGRNLSRRADILYGRKD
jgi:hypothetical protein